VREREREGESDWEREGESERGRDSLAYHVTLRDRAVAFSDAAVS
jgi:hypothetical protein